MWMIATMGTNIGALFGHDGAAVCDRGQCCNVCRKRCGYVEQRGMISNCSFRVV